MGKNNRQRRAEKRRRHDHGRGFRPPSGGDAHLLADFLVSEAAEASAHGDPAALDAAVEALLRLGPLGVSAITSNVMVGLRDAWEGGWQPADIVRAVAKRLDGEHVRLVGELIMMDAGAPQTWSSMPEQWASQLQDIQAAVVPDRRQWPDADWIRCGASLFGFMAYLPVLEQLMPPPSSWDRTRPATERRIASMQLESRMLDKVRALLAKAESTEFDEEADALTAKAQELMARHAIDHAMIAADDPDDDRPCGRRLGVDDPYAGGKASLLAAIARANRCRVVWMEELGFATVVGFGNDIDIVELLYTSLLVQATRAMTASGTVRDSAGRSRTRSFRQSFLLAFAGRIGERLAAATHTATEEAAHVHGGSLLPVLAGRTAAVDEAFADLFPDVRFSTVRISNAAGWAAGRAAADLAHLGPEQQLPGVAV